MKKNLFITFILITLLAWACCSAPVFAQEKKDIKPPAPQPVQTEEELIKTPAVDTNEEQPPKEEIPAPGSGIQEKVQIVTAIVVEGNSNISTDTIKSVLVTKIGDPLLEPKLIRDRRAIFDMGYFSDVSYSQVPFASGVKVLFKVLENPVVNKITIVGNSIVSTDKLLSLMETKVGQILNNRTLSADLAEIRNYYNEDLAYPVPNHVEDITWDEKGEVSIKIKEAMVIKEIVITGNKTFSTATIRKLMKIKEGDIFNQKVLAKDLTNVFNFYKEKDYTANIQQPQIDFDKGAINIDVAEVVVEDIQITGNEKTKTEFIKRILKLKPGMPLRNESIMRDHKLMQDLQLFDNIEIEPEQGSAADKFIVIWKVKEPAKYNFFTFGIGYGGGGGVSATSRTGLTGGIAANIRNISGKGQSASANWQRGTNIDTWAISFYNPAVNKRSDQIGFSIFNSMYRALRQPVYDTNPVQYSYYDDKRNGGSFSYGRWLGLDLRAVVGVRRESVALNQNINSTLTPVGLSSGSLNAMSLTGIYDTRDDIYNPYKGYYLNASGQFAGGPFRGSYGFNKYQGEIRKYFPLKKERCIALRVWGGGISGNAPAMEYFYLGGTDTLRGYEDNSLLGTRMLLANAEYRFPLGKIDILKGAVFADAGNAWSPGQSTAIKKDVGIGVRLVFQKIGLAVGVIRVDYAYKGGGQGRFAIGMGQTF